MVLATGDTSLQYLGQFCGGVTDLDIAYCERITDQGLVSLTEGCTKVTSPHCSRVVEPHRSVPFQLHTLRLARCQSITDKGLRCLGLRCPTLIHLDLTWCR